MTPEQAKALREPFPANLIGKLPKSTCRACSDSQRKRCDQHAWVYNCPLCHSNHSSAMMHLDYVGHAAATDRLLEVDPGWSWEPFALDQAGLPAADREGNLWIRLTICGVTRPGVGDGKNAKERISDAIRNAAMRFGVALDLWSKEDLAPPPSDTPSETVPAPADPIKVAKDRVWELARAKAPAGSTPQAVREFLAAALADAGFDANKLADLNSLIEEWESQL